MARLDLATRAERIAKAIAGRDLTQLPKTVQVQVDRFARAIGITAERFIGYAPSTRQKYIRAAKRGRTAAQERERVKAQRQQRQAAKRAEVPVDPRLIEIEQLRVWLDERIDTTNGPLVHSDYLDSDILLSRDGINEHLRVYGVAYVLRMLRGMKRGFTDINQAVDRWRGFKADMTIEDHPDERWYWYHGKLRMLDINDPFDLERMRRVIT